MNTVPINLTPKKSQHLLFSEDEYGASDDPIPYWSNNIPQALSAAAPSYGKVFYAAN